MYACTTAQTSTALTSAEETAIKLREGGMSYENIRKETGVQERRIKKLTAHILKPTKTKQKVQKIPTPFAKSTERVFDIASLNGGIRDYELRKILHEEYGTTWDTESGKYRSNYDSDTIKRIKEKVRKRAILENCNVIFVMDWIDVANPRASSDFLHHAASDLLDRIEGLADEFMALYGTHRNDEVETTEIARRKQRYAAKRHLLKLAVKGYSKEPIDKLLQRTATQVDALEGTPDAPLPESRMANGLGISNEAEAAYFPEPSRQDAFLDFAESQGWIKGIPARFI